MSEETKSVSASKRTRSPAYPAIGLQEALQKARSEDKPILLSVGYSACHWCHVMEHESFENEDIATLMNQHFVSIKVDREERPDRSHRREPPGRLRGRSAPVSRG